MVLVTKKAFWKNLCLLALFSTWKSAITISKVSKAKLSIFWALMLIFQILRPSFQAKRGFMVLILLPLLNKVFIYSSCNWTRWWMQSILTTFSLLSVTGTEVIETNASFVADYSHWQSDLFYCSWNTWSHLCYTSSFFSLRYQWYWR